MVGAPLSRPFFFAIGRRELLRSASLFAILIIATFPNVIFRGESLIAGDGFNPVGMACTPENHGPGSHRQRYFDSFGTIPWANVHDPGGPWWQSEPATELLQRSLRRGEFPLWDPSIGGGVPSMANLLPSYVFPPVFIIALAGNEPWMKNLYILAQLLAAGFFTYTFLRKHGLSVLASRAGGIAFLFSGTVVQTGPGFIGQAVIGMPIVLTATAWLLHKPTWRRAMATSFAYAFVALASFPPVLLFAFGLTVIYAAIVISLDPEKAGKRILTTRFAIAAMLSVGLVAFYYVPAFQLMRGSQSAARFYRDTGLQTLDRSQILQLLSPRLLSGAPALQGLPVSESNLFYFGVTGLLLATVTLGRARPFPLLLFQIAGLLVLLKIFGIPPVQWLGKLPVFNTIHFSWYGGILLGFCLAVCAGIAVDVLLEQRPHWWMVAIALILVAGAFLRLFTGFSVEGTAAARHWLAEFWLMLVIFAVAGSLLVGAIVLRNRAFGIALVALLALEGMSHAAFPRQKRWNYWDHPSRFARHLQAQPTLGRVLPMGFFPANVNSPFGIASVDSLFVFNADRYIDLHHRSFDSRPDPPLRECKTIPSDAILDAFAIDRMVVSSTYDNTLAEAPKRGFTQTYADASVVVFRRASAPRYSLTRDYAVVTPAEALRELPHRAPHHLLLERAPGFAPDPIDRGAGTVQVEHFGLNGYRLRAVSPRPSLLSASETNFPGWTARVNGKETPILAANYAFRAIEIPAGVSIVEFSYWPPGMTTGLVISAIALLIATATLALHARRDDDHFADIERQNGLAGEAGE